MLTSEDCLDDLIKSVVTQHPIHQPFISSALANLTAEERLHLCRYLDFCRKHGRSLDYLAKAYLTIVGDTIREQVYFQRHKKYRYSTFVEVAQSVYFNDTYMSLYMYGLAVTSFLWPNHLAIARFFRETIPNNVTGNYLEIGPGHGCFFQHAVNYSSYGNFVGVDISETSIGQTRALIDHFRKDDQKTVELRCLDFLACDLAENGFDAIVMGEVLEHVEQPERFLRQVRHFATDNAYIFVTTCINAPAIDHIYLFRDPSQIEELFGDCGFRIRRQLIRSYEGTDLKQSLARSLPVNVAYVLETT
jgi:2-polyprenyl-3-methyl-5-hydroxy-6-metoxy-1,4-benzoquinol methylase